MARLVLAIVAGVFLGAAIGLLPLSKWQVIDLYNLASPIYLIIAAIIIFGLISIFIFRSRLHEQKKNILSNLEKEKTEIAMQENKNLVDTIFENTNVNIAQISLDGYLLRVNQSLCQLLGYSESEMLAMNFYYLIHPNDLNNLQIHIQQLIDKKIKLYQSEQQCFRKSGEILWVMTTLSLIRDALGNPKYFVIQVENITLQKKAEERLRHMAYHDPLTGLANRNKLEQFVNHILATSRRHQQGFALLFLDLDRFKNINDTIGHEAGDLLLQIVADRLRSTVRNTDMVARLGGDEFVVLVTDVKKTEAIALIAEKILSSMLEVIVIKEQEIYITTSIGISFYPYDGKNMQTLTKNADLALYRAKEQGRNNYQFYTLEMTGKAQEKMALQNALAHALVKNEFFLNYQPKMDIKTRKITGVEALLRWKNSDYSAITPDEIVALAEETGLIIPVSEWILRTACKQLKVWHDMGLTSLTIAVNCTARQFKQTTFVDDVLTIVNEVGISPQSLEIEVTEKTIMEDSENTLRVLYALKDLGVQIAIDDFGTGYWSLSHLRRLSVDRIKIDKSFTKQVTLDQTTAAITSAIIGMVNRLGIKSIAEGVETKDQYEFLAKEDCTEIQGYYLTRPLAEAAMTKFLKHPVPDAEAITSQEITT